jgi:hypothetical protein
VNDEGEKGFEKEMERKIRREGRLRKRKKNR